MITFASLFTGFDGVGIGAKAAGLELVWGVELDPKIAAVANDNLGNHVRVANILDCDPHKFDQVDALHASPVCTNASVANANGGESELDKAMARKVAEFVGVLQPRIFTLENVWQYRGFESWCIIQNALYEAGYWLTVDHANAADYGVPQTRKRMIVRAIKGGFVPYLPEPRRWVGWYEAIEDLIDTLPESSFAPWQMARLPELLNSVLVAQNGYGGKVLTVDQQDPTFTITANHNQVHLRAFLVQVQGEGGDGVRFEDEPMQTVAANHPASKYRAFLMAGGGNTNFDEAYPGRGCRYEDEPAHTVTATSKEGGAFPKVFLVNGANSNANSGKLTIRNENEPSFVVTTGGTQHPSRALLDYGRVVAMTPRALARFQSFPDTYQLPDNARLAAKGIGNAVPPLLMQRIYEQLLEVL